QFNLTVRWPPSSLSTEKIQIFINNGLTTETVEPDFNENKIVISDTFISKYVTVSITVGENSYNLPAYSQFYVAEEPATLIFTSKFSNADESAMEIKATNAYDVKEISDRYASFIGELERKRDEYLKTNSLDSSYFTLFRELVLKKLEFISQNREC